MEPTKGLTSRATVSTPIHIPGLDGIRAIAFLMVLVTHSGLKIYTGQTGVTVFFFLSGYLITTLLRIEQAKDGQISLRAFYIRRIFRIFPPFYVTFFLAILLARVGIIHGNLKLRSLVLGLTYLGNYFMITPGHTGWPDGMGVTWSLAVEEHFYLAFPLLYFAISGWQRRNQAMILALLCAASFVWKMILAYGMHATHDRLYLATDTRFDSILFGCILAIIANPIFDELPGWVDRNLGVLAALGTVSALMAVHEPFFKVVAEFTFMPLALFPVFWFVLRRPESCVWLEHPILRKIGLWSYSLYLGHVVIIAIVEKQTNLPDPISTAIALPFMVLFAWLMNHLVERPSHRIRQRALKLLAKRDGKGVGDMPRPEKLAQS